MQILNECGSYGQLDIIHMKSVCQMNKEGKNPNTSDFCLSLTCQEIHWHDQNSKPNVDVQGSCLLCIMFIVQRLNSVLIMSGFSFGFPK